MARLYGVRDIQGWKPATLPKSAHLSPVITRSHSRRDKLFVGRIARVLQSATLVTCGSDLAESGRSLVVVVQHAAQTLAALDRGLCLRDGQHPARSGSCPAPGGCVRCDNGPRSYGLLSAANLPQTGPALRQQSLMLRKKLSVWAFRFGRRGGNLTDSTPVSFSECRNSFVNSGR